MKKWIVTAVNKGETCDGKARVLKVCDSKDEAKQFIKDDILDSISSYDSEDYDYDFDKMYAYVKDSDIGCEWNLEEVEI